MRRCAQNTGYGQPETDFYYAELSEPDSTSWDSNGNHQWGENSDPIDFHTEVNVGRIPWSTPSIVENICKKFTPLLYKKGIYVGTPYFGKYNYLTTFIIDVELFKSQKNEPESNCCNIL